MWGRKSVYGKSVHVKKQGEKKMEYPPQKPEKKEKQTQKLTTAPVNKKPASNTGKTISDFEKEYLKFIEELKNQQNQE